jgi:hypothetical protein
LCILSVIVLLSGLFPDSLVDVGGIAKVHKEISELTAGDQIVPIGMKALSQGRQVLDAEALGETTNGVNDGLKIGRTAVSIRREYRREPPILRKERSPAHCAAAGPQAP